MNPNWFSDEISDLKCAADAIYPSQCADFRDDYLECLHHRKEGARHKTIADEIERKNKEAEKNAKSEKTAPPSQWRPFRADFLMGNQQEKYYRL